MPKPTPQQAAHALGDMGADPYLGRQGRQALFGPQPVEGAAQVGGGIRQGAVQVEEDRFNHRAGCG
jgi:hypothetical protein